MAQGNVEFHYRLSRERFSLDARACIAARGVTGVFGRSGAGKSSLLRCIAGLEPGARGSFAVGEDRWEDAGRGRRLPPEARQVGYVFQEPRLFPHLSVRQNLEYGLRRRGRAQPVDRDAVVDLLALGALLDRRPGGLSGGEAQRVAIGRAVLSNPRILLLDEPLAALDAERKREVLPFLQRLQAGSGIPVLYVTHSMDELCSLCDQLVLLDEGRVAGAGDLQALLLQTGLPMLGGEQAGALLEAEVLRRDEQDGLCTLATGAGELFAPAPAAVGDRVRLRVRAGDVSLSLDAEAASSILNRVPASVLSIEDESAHSVLLHLRCGSETLLARITKRSARQLDVRIGTAFVAQIKAVSVRLAGL